MLSNVYPLLILRQLGPDSMRYILFAVCSTWKSQSYSAAVDIISFGKSFPRMFEVVEKNKDILWITWFYSN